MHAASELQSQRGGGTRHACMRPHQMIICSGWLRSCMETVMQDYLIRAAETMEISRPRRSVGGRLLICSS